VKKGRIVPIGGLTPMVSQTLEFKVSLLTLFNREETWVPIHGVKSYLFRNLVAGKLILRRHFHHHFA
jgi:hypothetical protein